MKPRLVLGSLMVLGAIISTMAQAPLRRVLLEEFTTAACGNCPPMSALIQAWHKKHLTSSILVNIHAGFGTDAMSNATTDSLLQSLKPATGSFVPAVMIDRGIYPGTESELYLNCIYSWGDSGGSGVDSIAYRLTQEAATVDVQVSGTYDATTRMIDATVDATFLAEIPEGNWAINLFLVEDSVVGTPNLGPEAWDQVCYNTDWAENNYYADFDGEMIIGYPHRDVLRDAMLGTWGDQTTIPSKPTINTTYTTHVTWLVDSSYQAEQCSFVAFVSAFGANKSDKFVLNANDTKLATTFDSRLNVYPTPETATAAYFDKIYPSPTNGPTKVFFTLVENGKSEIFLVNALGQQVAILANNITKTGKHEVDFDASGLAGGVYFIHLKTAKGTTVKKIVVQ